MAIDSDSLAETYQAMRRMLECVVPEFEIKYKAELVYEINRLKKERGAIILGHNYMEPALFHTVPDVVGDSLMLAQVAAKTNRDPVIFCGVRFMAETAKILNPQKTVLLPAEKAGCSLAQSISVSDIQALRARYPGVPIVAYINTYAEVKAEVDIICTSGNALKVVKSLPNETVIFVPDEYLAKNVAKESGKKVIIASSRGGQLDVSPAGGDGRIIGWNGRCEVHERFTLQDINNVRSQFPGVMVLAHPECSPEVVAAADYSGSTSMMVEAVRKSAAPHYLLLTECSMADNISAENPEKSMVRLCSIRCPHMNEITLEDTLEALRRNRYQIDVPEGIRLKAKKALDRMLEIS